LIFALSFLKNESGLFRPESYESDSAI